MLGRRPNRGLRLHMPRLEAAPYKWIISSVGRLATYGMIDVRREFSTLTARDPVHWRAGALLIAKERVSDLVIDNTSIISRI